MFLTIFPLIKWECGFLKEEVRESHAKICPDHTINRILNADSSSILIIKTALFQTPTH